MATGAKSSEVSQVNWHLLGMLVSADWDLRKLVPKHQLEEIGVKDVNDPVGFTVWVICRLLAVEEIGLTKGSILRLEEEE